MTSLDKAILATYDRDGKHFEIYIDPDGTYAFLDGSKKDLKNILVADEIYADAKKGERAKATDVEKVFGTQDMMQILEFMLRKGEVQLTTEQRRKKIAEKRKQIIAILLREAIDPRTKAPHTQIRLENAIEQARIHVEPFKDAREQIDDIVKTLRPILPMKFEKIKIAVKVPAVFSHKCYGNLKNYGIKKEQWTKEGDLIVVIEIFAGMQGEVYDKLNKMTNGDIETRIVEN
ncbi:ribosome assembly factor SBDS [Candidatus Micrarchaeota archaeon]|nr:ribosome assembly factor SBDS [Candidatus Micrarchaeota archaeon]